jgi:hypothetical protein
MRLDFKATFCATLRDCGANAVSGSGFELGGIVSSKYLLMFISSCITLFDLKTH